MKDLLNILLASLGAPEGLELTQLLKTLATNFDAQVAVLWEENQNNRLYVLAAWTVNGMIFAVHDVAPDSCPSGEAITTQVPQRKSGINWAPGSPHHQWLLNHLNITSTCAVPIKFTDPKDPREGNRPVRGVLTLYRNSTPFTAEEEAQLVRVSEGITLCYRSIRERTSLGLLQAVERNLREAETALQSCEIDLGTARGTFQKLVEQVGGIFRCEEVSLFLHDGLENPNLFYRVGTTWTQDVDTEPLSPAENHGCTRWVLYHHRPVLIFDLLHFDKNRKHYQELYPGIVWKDSLDLAKRSRERLRGQMALGESDLLSGQFHIPPLTYMAVPILDKGVVRGVLRCSGVKFSPGFPGPYYFTKRDLQLLELVSSQISRFWAASIHHRQVLQERHSRNAQTFIELAHQLKGPVLHLQRGTTDVARRNPGQNRELYRVRGIGRKIERVTTTINILARLNARGPLQLKLRPITDPSAFITRVDQLAEDHELYHDDVRIRYRVLHRTFDYKDLEQLSIDEKMFEQAISCLLENAGKYSFPSTTVAIYAEKSNKGNFQFCVANVGIKIRPHETAACVQREWRSEEARLVTGEGSGIGLWIVRKIMDAHFGNVEILPTNADDETIVKLVLPIRKKECPSS